MPRATPLAMLLLTCATLATGCVQRTIHITSEPSGALVHLNDEEVGRTPLSVPFTFYGVYDVRLDAEGHEPLWTAAKADAPWWEFPGPDLVAEMVPGTRSDVRWHFTLDPAPAPEDVDADALRDRARELRATTPAPASP
ncbi:MAG: PEGA domain-containing protein [Phycisphaeraceae bacterium]